MHLATLVHDDSVDHSVLRRGLPTVNSLFSHQVSVIMGDFLYTRALMALVRMGDLAIMKIVADVANELTIGEMRQLSAVDALHFTEDEYEHLIRAKTASLMAGACESGALCGATEFREQLARLRRPARNGLPDRGRHPGLHRGPVGDGKARRPRFARAQSDAAADCGPAARHGRPAAAGSTSYSPRRRPDDE